MSGFEDIWDDQGLDMQEYVIGWLVIIGTEEDEGRFILKTMRCDAKGKLRQSEQEISSDIRMPNFVHKTTWGHLQKVISILALAHVNDPIIGVGKKIADDVYWIEGGYEKTLNNG